jgi:hypothetical protein
MSWQFTVGLRVKRNADRIVVDAEDALIAALKVKAERPEATIMYVRRLNRSGDTRHPPHALTGGRWPRMMHVRIPRRRSRLPEEVLEGGLIDLHRQ